MALPPARTRSSSDSGLQSWLPPQHPVPQALYEQSLYICFCWTSDSINLIKIILFGSFQRVDTSSRPSAASVCTLHALARAAVGSSDCCPEEWEEECHRQNSGKEQGREKNGKCFKIQREKVGTVKIGERCRHCKDCRAVTGVCLEE